jgi:hypothetical protein
MQSALLEEEDAEMVEMGEGALEAQADEESQIAQ